MLLAPAVVDEDGVRDDRRRRDAIILLNEGFHSVGGQHLQRGTLRWPGKRMRVFAHVQRPIDTLGTAILADGLCDGEDVRLVERPV